MGIIYFTERNIRGAWVVYGIDGVKQYYYCTKKEAIEKYREEALKRHFVNMDVKK